MRGCTQNRNPYPHQGSRGKRRQSGFIVNCWQSDANRKPLPLRLLQRHHRQTAVSCSGGFLSKMASCHDQAHLYGQSLARALWVIVVVMERISEVRGFWDPNLQPELTRNNDAVRFNDFHYGHVLPRGFGTIPVHVHVWHSV